MGGSPFISVGGGLGFGVAYTTLGTGNQAQFNQSLATNTFGQIRLSLDPRILQFALKYTFRKLGKRYSLEKIPKQARSRGLYARVQAQLKNYSAGTCNAGIKPAATSLPGRFGNSPHLNRED